MERNVRSISRTLYALREKPLSLESGEAGITFSEREVTITTGDAPPRQVIRARRHRSAY
jgi:hypothetical protein